MTRSKKTSSDRQTLLQSQTPPSGGFTLAGVRLMYQGVGGETYPCTVTAHCRTRIFEFPRISLGSETPISYHTIFDSGSIQAVVVSDLVGYFENTRRDKHYSLSPSLRHEVSEIAAKVSSQKKEPPVFVVIHEYNQVQPTVMSRGECSIQDEVISEEGEEVKILVGGRRGETFITAWRSTDGCWPTVPDNQRRINLILSAVRAEQDADGEIAKHIDQGCFETDTGRFVVMMGGSGSAKLSIAKSMDAQALMDASLRIKRALGQMEPDADEPYLGLLVDSMYWDKEAQDAEQRLRYLSLWQSLAESRKKLGYMQEMRSSDVVAGKKSVGELTDYRDDLAHYRTDKSDQQALRDIQLTANELIRRKYFRP